MKRLKLHSLLLLIAVLSTVSIAQHHHSSEPKAEQAASENSKLIDEFGALPHCDLTGRYDLFFAELSQNPNSQGYILIYQGTDGLPAHYDDPPAERMFRNHMTSRRFDAARITVVNGGFQEQGRTQLWIVPQGAVPPTPEGTIRKPEIPSDKTFMFDRGYLALEEEDQENSEYVLPSVKAEREAERKKWIEEARLERIAAGEQDVDVEPVEDEGASAETEEPELEIKFTWVSESFGALLAKRAESRGVVVFYADDQHFDINNIRTMIDDGIDRLSKSASLKDKRIEVVFGGYRNSTGVEYWVVPKDGEAPTPTPEERPVEEPEHAEPEN